MFGQPRCSLRVVSWRSWSPLRFFLGVRVPCNALSLFRPSPSPRHCPWYVLCGIIVWVSSAARCTAYVGRSGLEGAAGNLLRQRSRRGRAAPRGRDTCLLPAGARTRASSQVRCPAPNHVLQRNTQPPTRCLGFADFACSGSVIDGRWTVGRRLGGGSFGEIYEATDADGVYLPGSVRALPLRAPHLKPSSLGILARWLQARLLRHNHARMCFVYRVHRRRQGSRQMREEISALSATET